MVGDKYEQGEKRECQLEYCIMPSCIKGARILLCTICGATSFEDLRIVKGFRHPAFKATYSAVGLLDRNEWHEALHEAARWATGS